MDSSSSIGRTDFAKQLDFVKNLVRQFDVGPTKTQFSVVSFSSSVWDEFRLNRYTSKTQTLGAIARIPWHTGNTYTEQALDHVTSYSFQHSHGGRANATKLVIVLTDGQAQHHTETVAAAAKLHNTGAKVIAIGIGRADRDELQSIASDNKHLFMVATFDVLHTIMAELEVQTCGSCKLLLDLVHYSCSMFATFC